jgi:hypothetical protein
MKTTIDMACEVGLHLYVNDITEAPYAARLKAFEALVRADEREACAKLCDDLPPPEGYNIVETSFWDVTSLACGDAIRARGTTHDIKEKNT